MNRFRLARGFFLPAIQKIHAACLARPAAVPFLHFFERAAARIQEASRIYPRKSYRRTQLSGRQIKKLMTTNKTNAKAVAFRKVLHETQTRTHPMGPRAPARGVPDRASGALGLALEGDSPGTLTLSALIGALSLLRAPDRPCKVGRLMIF